MAKLDTIAQDALREVSNTRELGQKTGAGIVASTFNETNADEVNERLKAVAASQKQNIEAARAASTEQAGTAQKQEGNQQVEMAKQMPMMLMMAAGPLALLAGPWVGVAALAGGAVMGLMQQGQANQAEGEQKIAEAPPMVATAADLGNQSEGHFNKAEQIRSEKEAEQATNEDSSDPNSAKEIGKGKGYYVADSGNAGASTDDELVADRLNAGEEAVNAQLGITDKEGGIATDDKTTIANRLNEVTDNINGLIGAQSDQSSDEQAINKKLGITTASDAKESGIGTDDKTTIASRLKDGAGEVDNLLGVEKEKIG
jgi:hypothetical protein